MPDPVHLITTKSDAEAALEYRDRMAAALEPVLAVMNEAFAQNLIINFNLKPDGLGKHHIASILVMKKLA